MTRVAVAVALLTVGFAHAVKAGGPEPGSVPPLVTRGTHDFYVSQIPKGVFTEDEKSRMLFYDTDSMPPSYQFEGGDHSPYYNISQKAVQPGVAEPHANAIVCRRRRDLPTPLLGR